MKKYRKDATSGKRVTFGVELEEGMRLRKELAEHVPVLAKKNTELEQALENRLTLEKPLGRWRARLRFNEAEAEAAVRMLAREIEVAEGGRRGPIFEYMLPDGLRSVLAPGLMQQVEPLEQLRHRIATRPAVSEEHRQAWLGRLDGPLAGLKAAAEGMQAARSAYLLARDQETVQCEEHAILIDKLMGVVRAAFPQDRVRQDSVFPVVAEPSRSSRKTPAAVPQSDPIEA